MTWQLHTPQISRLCKARPEAVSDLPADRKSHVVWAGARQTQDFHLVSLEAPPGPAAVGTSFSSTGVIPMSRRRWSDRSTVSIADRPLKFEITTQATAGDRNAMTAVYRNTYDTSPATGGPRV